MELFQRTSFSQRGSPDTDTVELVWPVDEREINSVKPAGVTARAALIESAPRESRIIMPALAKELVLVIESTLTMIAPLPDRVCQM